MPDAHPERDIPAHLLASPTLATRMTHHLRSLPLRVGTRGSPLALTQTRIFLALLARFCPVLAPGYRDEQVFQQHIIRTTGDKVQDRALDVAGRAPFIVQPRPVGVRTGERLLHQFLGFLGGVDQQARQSWR